MTSNDQIERDPTEHLRRMMASALNGRGLNRQDLEKEYPDGVWDTEEFKRNFVVQRFMAPYVVVVRKSDGVAGTLLFQHEPRFYFDWHAIETGSSKREIAHRKCVQEASESSGKFMTEQLLATPKALTRLRAHNEEELIGEYVNRHLRGDWGDICHEDISVNEESLRTGQRLMSVFHTPAGTTIWVITEAAGKDGRRRATTLLLPEDY